tara:strand:+ start:227 stop:805 length:579 start_codon:yes stop_codon:yes gene_type:complete
MGQHKALLPTSQANETFIGRIVRVLREGGVDDVVVVVGPHMPALDVAFTGQEPLPRVVINQLPDRGQLSSLLVGLSVVDRPGVAGVLVTLVDVPLIDSETVYQLKELYQETRAPVVRPTRNGRHGHPVIFDRAVFSELRRADHAVGAKAVVHTHLTDAVELAVDSEGSFLDIDTPADYMRAFNSAPPEETDH